ncbi:MULTISPECIES: glutathione S-transferase family protein [Cyanophyceae]|uniref:Glutathione S-transferase family protein n=1 Tax=Leptolyngbya subtilissima DQ-A4 TaxID=2933933 RepID=A0ABV0K0Y1_9CYAN|nr:glutathione S-transferase family protein [Nodosilinea sp. FACHB-141]MBD2111212.1 glutathione S-transferase family protein [Nodosilinea sp. FACHB-141]
MALGRLINGKWSTEWTERSESGEFQRMPTLFHDWVTADGSSGFKAEPGRYHLYVSLGCPWAHRTVLLRSLKGLQGAIGLSIVDPVISDQGWKFSQRFSSIPDSLYGAEYLWQLYTRAKASYTGRVTVPVLWDTQTQTIVNNESRQIIQMLNSAFNDFAEFPRRDFYPNALRPQIDAAMDAIYQPINNGVYRSGFAASQAAYNDAVTELFEALDHWEEVLGQQRYLVGDQITLADWCMFTTLFRFDLAYYGLFKTNLKRLVDYPNLWGYCRELYQRPGVAEWCSAEHVKQLYYAGLPELNPSGIVPAGPAIDYGQPRDRDRI